MVLKLCPVIPANAGIHNHLHLLNGFDRDRFIASAAFGVLSALPGSGLFGRQASLGRPEGRICLPSFVQTERPLLIATESLAAPTAALRQEPTLPLGSPSKLERQFGLEYNHYRWSAPSP
jgi:hypothetical protein